MRIPKTWRGYRRAVQTVLKRCAENAVSDGMTKRKWFVFHVVAGDMNYEGPDVQYLFNGWDEWKEELFRIPKEATKEDVEGYWEDYLQFRMRDVIIMYTDAVQADADLIDRIISTL